MIECPYVLVLKYSTSTQEQSIIFSSGADEDTKHILFSCHRFINLRRELFFTITSILLIYFFTVVNTWLIVKINKYF